MLTSAQKGLNMDKSLKTLFLSALVFTLAGCQNVDNLQMPPAHSGLTGFTANDEDISHHLHSAINRLNILKLQGGVSCVPASVWTINKTLKLADRNLRAKLLIDAANAVILAQSQLTHAQKRVNYLTERTDCNDTITASLMAKRNQTVEQPQSTPKDDQQHQRFDEHTINIIELLLNGNNQFASDKAELTVSYISHLELAAPMINQFDDMTIMLTGHTDAIGSEQNNLQLSQQRVEKVKSKLIELGVKASQITIVANGESVPLATNNTATGRLANRRVSANISLKTNAETQDITTQAANQASQASSKIRPEATTLTTASLQQIPINNWWKVLSQPTNTQASNVTEYPHTGR